MLNKQQYRWTWMGSSTQKDKTTDLEVVDYFCVYLHCCLHMELQAMFLSAHCPSVCLRLQKYRKQVGGREVADCETLGFSCHLSRHQEDNILTFNPCWRRYILAPVFKLFICTHTFDKMWDFKPQDATNWNNKLYTLSLFCFVLSLVCGHRLRKNPSVQSDVSCSCCIILNHNLQLNAELPP